MVARKLLLAGVALAGLTAAAPPPSRVDRAGDPLPPDALLRLGTLRHREAHLWWESRDRLLDDGKTQLVGRHDKVVEVDPETGRRRAVWTLPKGYTTAGFTADGRMALIHDAKSVLATYDFRGGKWARKFEDHGPITHDVAAHFSADGSFVLTAIQINGNPCVIRAWDVKTGKLRWHEGKMFQHGGLAFVDFLPGEKELALIDIFDDGRVSVREAATGKERWAFRTLSRGDLRSYRLSPDGKAVVLGTAGKAARVWDLATGKELPSLDGHGEQAYAVASSREGRLVATGGADAFVLVREWPTGKLIRRIDLPAGWFSGRMAFSADGKRLRLRLHGEEVTRIFDVKTGREIVPYTEAHTGQVFGVGVAPDGLVVTGGQEGALRVWDLGTGRQVREFHTGFTHHGHRASIHTMTANTDGRLVVTGQVNEGVLRLFDRDTGRQVRTITAGERIRTVHLGGRDRLLIYADERLAGTGSHPFLALHDATTGKELHRLSHGAYGECAISRDGTLIAGPHADGPCLWDAAAGRRMRKLPSEVGSFALAPDNHTLVGLQKASRLVAWELATGQPRWQAGLPEKGLSRNRPCFSRDGRWLAVAREFDVDLWDALHGRRVHTFRGHENYVNALDFSPDGRKLVSGSSDTTLLVWDVAGVLARLPSRETRLDAAALQAAWQDLAGADVPRASRALAALVEAPRESVPWLRGRLKPVRALDAGHVERLLAKLDADAFAEREGATRELERLGPDAEAPLRRYLESKPSAEGRRRAERLLGRVEHGGASEPEHLRQLRALEVLERIGDTSALDVLKGLANGARAAWLTRQASAAVRRLRDYR